MCTGCSNKPAAGARYVKSQTGDSVKDDVMTAAAMCAACGYAPGIVCTVDGQPTETHARAVQCPKGRHPIDGIVRWLVLCWYGVPLPLRFALRLRGKVTNITKLPGCGCIKVLRDLWERAKRDTQDEPRRKPEPSD